MAHLGGAPRRVTGGSAGPATSRACPATSRPAVAARDRALASTRCTAGWAPSQKFPQADAFAYLLAFGALRPRRRDGARAARISQVARTTLTNMATGELYDRVAGGFFRYSTQRDWSEPHYEKMLEDNARLATLYLDASEMAAGDDGSDARQREPLSRRRRGRHRLPARDAAPRRRAVPSAAARTPTRTTTASDAGERAKLGDAVRRPDGLRRLERAGGPRASRGRRRSCAGRSSSRGRCELLDVPLGARAPGRGHGSLPGDGR